MSDSIDSCGIGSPNSGEEHLSSLIALYLPLDQNLEDLARVSGDVQAILQESAREMIVSTT